MSSRRLLPPVHAREHIQDLPNIPWINKHHLLGRRGAIWWKPDVLGRERIGWGIHYRCVDRGILGFGGNNCQWWDVGSTAEIIEPVVEYRPDIRVLVWPEATVVVLIAAPPLGDFVNRIFRLLPVLEGFTRCLVGDAPRSGVRIVYFLVKARHGESLRLPPLQFDLMCINVSGRYKRAIIRLSELTALCLTLVSINVLAKSMLHRQSVSIPLYMFKKYLTLRFAP